MNVDRAQAVRGPDLLAIEQDGDFAVLLDRDGEVGGLVVIEIAGRDSVAVHANSISSLSTSAAHNVDSCSTSTLLVL